MTEPTATHPHPDSLADRIACRTGCSVVQISPGWEPIIRRLDGDLRSIDPGYRLECLHAHDGALTIWWRPGKEPGWPRLADEADLEARKQYEEEVGRYLHSMVHRRRLEWEDQVVRAGRELVAEALREATRTCEDCGAPGMVWESKHLGARRAQCRPCMLEHGFYR